MKIYQDLHSLGEDERIKHIGYHAMYSFGKVNFMVNCTDVDTSKGDRYIEKLTKAFPNIKVLIRRKHHPIQNVETIGIEYVGAPVAGGAHAPERPHPDDEREGSGPS